MRFFILLKIPAILLLTGIACCSRAQLCQGSLGDPVVNITFGSGPNPGPPLKAAAVNYTYTTSSCPSDGYYTITNSSSGCFRNSWHTVTQDATGTPNGYFMLINASYQPSDFYLDTIRGLCTGTTYEFASWILNIMNNPHSILPNITFSIEQTNGQVLQTYNTGDIAVSGSPDWKHYGFYFTTPAGLTDVVVRMRNNAPGGTGNDLALDNITFRPCGPYISIGFHNPAGENTWRHCYNKDTTYTIYSTITPDNVPIVLQWQESTNNGNSWQDIPGANGATLVRHFDAGSPRRKYFFRLTGANNSSNLPLPSCRIASNTSLIVVDPADSISASANILCTGDTLQLSASGGYQYNWSGPAHFSTTGPAATIYPATPANSGTYYVVTTATGGCSIKDSLLVAVKEKPVAAAGKDTSICSGKSTVLQGSGNGNYTWSPATGLSDPHVPNPVASPADTTRYQLVVTSAANCADSAAVTINVLKLPKANAGPDKVIFEGQSTQLNGTVSGTNTSYYWTPDSYISNSRILQPAVNPVNDITYVLHAVSACGQFADSAFVRVYKKVIIPNSFSPNGDGINDLWRIEALTTYPNADVAVFNRYGQTVFHSTGYNQPWDGTLNGRSLPVETYYYVIDLRNGTPKLAGWVLLIR